MHERPRAALSFYEPICRKQAGDLSGPAAPVHFTRAGAPFRRRNPQARSQSGIRRRETLEIHLIVAGLIEKAAEGGAVQAKFLFDFAGIAASQPAVEEGESLLEIMRRELRLEEPPEGTVE
jgi:hypothetical protein